MKVVRVVFENQVQVPGRKDLWTAEVGPLRFPEVLIEEDEKGVLLKADGHPIKRIPYATIRQIDYADVYTAPKTKEAAAKEIADPAKAKVAA